MKAYKISVPTTNASRDKFKLGATYIDCAFGFVYVVAPNIEAAARMVPTAETIELLGPAYVPHSVG